MANLIANSAVHPHNACNLQIELCWQDHDQCPTKTFSTLGAGGLLHSWLLSSVNMISGDNPLYSEFGQGADLFTMRDRKNGRPSRNLIKYPQKTIKNTEHAQPPPPKNGYQDNNALQAGFWFVTTVAD